MNMATIGQHGRIGGRCAIVIFFFATDIGAGSKFIQLAQNVFTEEGNHTASSNGLE